MDSILVTLVFGLFIIGAYFVQEFKIPQIVPEDYDCEAREGIISNSNPFPLESPQHYINRHSRAMQKQIEEVCPV